MESQLAGLQGKQHPLILMVKINTYKPVLSGFLHTYYQCRRGSNKVTQVFILVDLSMGQDGISKHVWNE
jgi:hypothetical protein